MTIKHFIFKEVIIMDKKIATALINTGVYLASACFIGITAFKSGYAKGSADAWDEATKEADKLLQHLEGLIGEAEEKIEKERSEKEFNPDERL